MVMVPTTGGSGADVSQFCVVTDTQRGLKATIGGRALVPEISLTDPELLTTMPPELTAHTGLDADVYAEPLVYGVLCQLQGPLMPVGERWRLLRVLRNPVRIQRLLE